MRVASGQSRQITQDEYSPMFTSRTGADVINICREPGNIVILSANGDFQSDGPSAGWSMKGVLTSGEMFTLWFRDPFQGLLHYYFLIKRI